MRKYTLILFLGLFLFLSAGQSMQLVDWAYANCCNPRLCGNWPGIVYGGIELEGATAKITIGKKSYPVEVSQDLEKAFKEAKTPITHAYGFIVVTGFGPTQPKKLVVTAFVPADRENHDRKISAENAVKRYNKEFESYFE